MKMYKATYDVNASDVSVEVSDLIILQQEADPEDLANFLYESNGGDESGDLTYPEVEEIPILSRESIDFLKSFSVNVYEYDSISDDEEDYEE